MSNKCSKRLNLVLGIASGGRVCRSRWAAVLDKRQGKEVVIAPYFPFITITSP